MEISAALVGVLDLLVESFHLVNVREHRVGIFDHVKALVPEALHVVAVATTTHSGCRCQLCVKVVLEAAVHVGLGIHTDIRHEIVSGETDIVPVAIKDVCLQLLVAHGECRLQAFFCRVSNCWLVE